MPNTFSYYLNAAQRNDRSVFPALTVAGNIFYPTDIDYSNSNITIVYATGRRGDQDRITVNAINIGRDTGTLYATGQIGNVPFRADAA